MPLQFRFGYRYRNAMSARRYGSFDFVQNLQNTTASPKASRFWDAHTRAAPEQPK